MTRVHVICEGQTEEMFVNEVLVEALSPKGIHLYPSLLGKPGHKGGHVNFDRLLTDIRARLLGDASSYCTTFFDFYGIDEDLSTMKSNSASSTGQKSEFFLNELCRRLSSTIGVDPMRRFIPYVQMHEYEALLFSAPDAFARGIFRKSLETPFQRVRDSFDSPEDIDDSVENAPSKRIENLFPAYEKPLYGSLAAIEIGLEAIRRECRLFDGWLKTMETLPS